MFLMYALGPIPLCGHCPYHYSKLQQAVCQEGDRHTLPNKKSGAHLYRMVLRGMWIRINRLSPTDATLLRADRYALWKLPQ